MLPSLQVMPRERDAPLPPHLAEDGAQADELGVELVVEGLERLGVLGVGDEPEEGGGE